MGSGVERAEELANAVPVDGGFPTPLDFREKLLEVIPAGVYTCDAEGRITSYNRAAAELWGRSPETVQPEERFCGSHRLYWPDGTPLPHAETPMAIALREGRSFRDAEVVIERPDGRRRTALVNIAVRKDEAGRVTGAVSCFSDITERKRDREALLQADRRKDEFLAMLSHELRNPLAPTRNAVELLREERGDPAERKKALDTLDRQVGTLTRLVEDLLDVSRLTTGTIRLREEHLDLAAVLRETIDSVHPLFEERRQRLSVSLPAAPLRVRGDAMRLEQVVVNLLGNASKYTPEGGRISLEAWRETGDGVGPEVVVRVKDDGVGMEPELLAGAFELFRKGEDRDQSQNGLGLGLSLVKRLAEKHGGSVAAFSEGPGRGSEFIVRLPLAEGRTAVSDTTPEAVAEAVARPIPETPSVARSRDVEEEPPTAGRTRVLVVDDNRDAARMLVSVLRLRGYRVRAAYDGRSALRLAADFEPAVVLLDICMPEMDGYEVARRLRNGDRSDARPLLVAMTGYGQSEDKRRSREAGFDHHLVKPTDFAELRIVLESAAT